jgi:hypothetical protein
VTYPNPEIEIPSFKKESKFSRQFSVKSALNNDLCRSTKQLTIPSDRHPNMHIGIPESRGHFVLPGGAFLRAYDTRRGTHRLEVL